MRISDWSSDVCSSDLSQLSLERPSPHVLLARDQRTPRICRQRPVTRSNQGDRHECRDDAQERYEHSNGHNASRHWRALRERSRRLEPSLWTNVPKRRKRRKEAGLIVTTAPRKK